MTTYVNNFLGRPWIWAQRLGIWGHQAGKPNATKHSFVGVALDFPKTVFSACKVHAWLLVRMGQKLVQLIQLETIAFSTSMK